MYIFDFVVIMLAYCPFKNKHCVLLHSTVGVVKPNFKLSCFTLPQKKEEHIFLIFIN